MAGHLWGFVTAELEPVVQLNLIDGAGFDLDLDAAVDTGFNGELTMPPSLIAACSLTPGPTVQKMLADGAVRSFISYSITLDLFGARCSIAVIPTADGRMPLVGMSILRGCDIRIAMEPGGEVEIIPPP